MPKFNRPHELLSTKYELLFPLPLNGFLPVNHRRREHYQQHGSENGHDGQQVSALSSDAAAGIRFQCSDLFYWLSFWFHLSPQLSPACGCPSTYFPARGCIFLGYRFEAGEPHSASVRDYC
jgi:hypothetical protein